MNRQAEEAGRLADELQEMIIAGQGNTGKVTPTPQQQEGSQQAPAPESAKVVEDQQDYATLLHKFNVLKGKYDHEVPLLHEELKQLKGAKSQWEAERIQLMEQVQAAQKQGLHQSEGVDTEKSERIQAIERELGTDIVEVINSLMTEIQQLKQAKPSEQKGEQGDGAGKQPSEEAKTLYAKRFGVVANHIGSAFGLFESDKQTALLKKIDTNPDFNSWLTGQDHPAYPETRRENMQRLFGSGRLEDAARYYIDWYREFSKLESQSDDLLSEQQQPTTNGAKPQQEPAGRTYKESEIAEIQKQLAINPKYKNSKEGKEEADRLDNEITAAYLEGRVIFGQ